MRNSIRSTLAAMLIGFAVLLVVIGGLGAHMYRSALGSEEALFREATRQLSLAQAINEAFKQQVTDWYLVLLRGHRGGEYHRFLSSFYDAERETRSLARALADAIPDDERAAAMLSRFVDGHRALGQRYRRALAAYNSADSDPRSAAEELIDDAPTTAVEILRQVRTQLIETRDRRLQALNRDIARLEWSLLAVALILSFGTLVLLLWYLDRRIGRPISSAISFAQDIAGGEYGSALPHPSQSRRRDEVGRLLAALQEMRDNLRLTYDLKLALVERERAQAALRDSEARFRDVVETTSDWIWEIDPELRITFLSDRFSAETGISAADAIGRRWADAAPPSESGEHPRRWAALRADLEAHRPFRDYEYAATGTPAGDRVISISGNPLFAEDGRFLGYRGTATDITDRKMAEKALRESEERLVQAQKMEAVGQLTGGIAHDFNNLLTIMRGNMELLEERIGDDENARRYMKTALSSVDRGATLTARLLAFSRRQTLIPTSIDAGEMIRGMTDLLRRTIEESVEIKIVVPDGLWHCEADRAQLENALLNLAINARDAMSGVGELTVEVENVAVDAENAVQHEDLMPGDYVCITVTDNGIGISKAALSHVFEPFFTTKETGRGSGLGLSMVYGFARQSGGQVTIYSEEGDGTSVRLYLPRASGEANHREVRATRAAAPAQDGESVLVLEDDEDVRALTVTQLQSLGYRVFTAASGRVALDLLAGLAASAGTDSSPPVDLLLSDVVLAGGMNGREVVEQASALYPGLRVLYMSGYTEEAILHHGRLDPGVELLQKPFRRDDLGARVRALLDGN